MEPVEAGTNGVKLRPELMEEERLYHCVYGGVLMVLFKDSAGMLNCYEIDDEEMVRQARAGCDVGAMLEERAAKTKIKARPSPGGLGDADDILSEIGSRGDGPKEPPPGDAGGQDAPQPDGRRTGQEPAQGRPGAGRGPRADPAAVLIGDRPVVSYVTETLLKLATHDTVTLKARGKKMAQAVDVSQMILRRVGSAGYVISGIRTSSAVLASDDGRPRRVSMMEIDISKDDS